jgi:transcriptional regulator with XRE-family HTH domain
LEQGFGEVLRQLRRERKFTQDELAEASGCHRAHVSFLERGLKSPTLNMLFQLAAALEVSPAEMVRQVEARISVRTASTSEGEAQIQE